VDSQPPWLSRPLTRLWQALRSRQPLEETLRYLRSQPALVSTVYWASAFAAALLAVGYAKLFHACSEAAQVFLVRHPFVFLLVAPCFFWLAWWLVFRYAPAAAGSGIPQAMAAIEADPERASSWVSPKVAMVKVGSSLACLLGGGAIGREGPTVQLAASIFYAIGMPFRAIWPQIDHPSLLIAGGAAGIAAAFNTPLGGIVFAIEELSQQHFSRFRTFLISGVIVAGLVSQWILGPYLFFGGYPRLPEVAIDCVPWALACGIAGGVGGGLFGRLLTAFTARLKSLPARQRGLFAIGVGLFMVASAYCISPEIMGGGNEWISKLLLTPDKQVSWGLMIGRFLGPLATSLTGCAGGIFAPSLAAGAAIGAKLALLARPDYTNLIMVLTMIGFLTGVTRAPFTSFVLVLEMTDRHSAIFPMMATSLIASVAALLIDKRGYYQQRAVAYLAEAGLTSTGH
jgi:H+/Cl- antiporter ClcA